MAEPAPLPRAVVIGGGFGGLNAVRGLAGVPARVILIDRRDHHLFQPLLYQVATATLASTDIASSLRAMLAGQRNAEVILGEVEGVDVGDRQVRLRGAAPVPYDILVVATGARTSWFGHADWARHAPGLKDLADAHLLRRRLSEAFERAEREATAPPRFVVVGGGATGVEMAGAIRELARVTLPGGFRRIRPEDARVTLLEAGSSLLPGMPERLRRYAGSRLRALGVEIRMGMAVDSVDAAGAWAGGERFDGEVIWCAGVAATPAASWLGVTPGRHGALPVEADCTLAGHPEIFAIGDVATPKAGPAWPGVAPLAKQQGRYVARVIAARLAGRTAPSPFRYRDQGSLTVIGRTAAVAALPRASLTGFTAWMVWSGVHLLLLNGLRNRALVTVQWAFAWLFPGRGPLPAIAGHDQDHAGQPSGCDVTSGKGSGWPSG